MKAKKAEDLKTKSADELVDILMEMKQQQFNLRLQLSQGQLGNPAQLRTVRRDIARVKTLMSANKAGAHGAAGTGKKKAAKAKSAKAAAAPKAKKAKKASE